MSDGKTTLTKMVSAVVIPIVGIPLYEVGYERMNESFGSGDNSWAVTIYTVLYVLVFALVPLGLLYSVFRSI